MSFGLKSAILRLSASLILDGYSSTSQTDRNFPAVEIPAFTLMTHEFDPIAFLTHKSHGIFSHTKEARLVRAARLKMEAEELLTQAKKLETI